MKKTTLFLLFVFCVFGNLSYAQNLKVDDNMYKEKKIRNISTTMERRYSFELVDGGQKGSLYPIMDLKIDLRNPQKQREQWSLALYFISDFKIAYVKGARLLIKFSDKEILELKTSEGDSDRIGRYSNDELEYFLHPYFLLTSAQLTKLTTKQIAKIRFEFINGVAEAWFNTGGDWSLSYYLNLAKQSILAQKSKTKDSLYDGF